MATVKAPGKKNPKAKGKVRRADWKEQAAKALEIMAGGKTMAWAAFELKVSVSTAWDWMQTTEFKPLYERARLVSAQSYVRQAEETLTPDMDGMLLLPHQVTLLVARAKQKLWLAGKLSQEFSDKQTITHEGNPEKPVEHNVKMSATDAYKKMLGGT